MTLIPIIISGGAGSRLWPVSRHAEPKPFMEVAGKPLLAHAVDRALVEGAKDLIIVTNQDHLHLSQQLIAEYAPQVNAHFVLEPKGRNTAPAIAQAVHHVIDAFGEAAHCLVLPADHIVTDLEAFKEAVAKATALSGAGDTQDALVTFGVVPTAPDTGYGYIEVAEAGKQPAPVRQFVEKPDLPTAQEYLASGRYFWNSGMFYFSAAAMAKALKAHAADVWSASADCFATSTLEAGVRRFNEAAFLAQPDISIDYAVFEPAETVMTVPAGFGWSDVGTWDTVAAAQSKTADGNSAIGVPENRLMQIGTHNTHIESFSQTEKMVATLGVDNLVIIDLPDTLMVANRADSQQVKNFVDELKSGDAFMQATTQLPAVVSRPWGTYATLKHETGYQVKRISVQPGQQLSLQYHHKRAEHWVVVQGLALVQVGDEELETKPGEYRYIPLGEKHRLTNVGTDELILIEVQCGSYLGEDDIVRLEDNYGRS
jgi:mannose-1-phosphate guanylyltransferase/mannose-6-phosphate isomerase